MSTTYVNPASNISYTAKDFQTIFPNLLSLTKELSSRWDPSISDESDPGIVLLKLDAILADKLNYNIDKNILEAFPLSLTQMSSAKRIYSLLGYRMKWFKSAWCDVTLLWTGDIDTDNYVTIPIFTEVSDDTTSLSYTLVGYATEDLEDGEFSPSDIVLPFYGTTGKSISARAIQGKAVTFSINDNTVISANQLDSENRLYFSTTDIAENGIFIKNTGATAYDWTRVDNLVVEQLGKKYFEFGVTDDLYSCYLEFPEDAEDLFKDGIEITYITTIGKTGNISAGTLTRFASDLYLADQNDTSVSLTTDNVSINNLYAATSGTDPDTIAEAYTNYKKLVGTFDTLVTLRDYMNSFKQSGLLSNCLVCDSTNDHQCSYIVKAIINGVNTDQVTTEEVETSNTITVKGDVSYYYINGQFYDKLVGGNVVTIAEGVFCTDLITGDVYYSTGSSYIKIKTDTKHTFGITENAIDTVSIKLYILQDVDEIDSMSDYISTFDLLPNQSLQDDSPIKQYIAKQKHIGHTYADILPTTDSAPRPCLFKNKYTITARLYTTTTVTDVDKTSIKNNIIQVFYENLNAAKVNFGEAVQLDSLASLISSADNRIKTVYIDSLTYKTYAVYYVESEADSLGNKTGQFYEVCISNSDAIENAITYSAPAAVSTTNYKKGDIAYFNGHRQRCLRNNVLGPIPTAWTVDEYEFDVDYDAFVKVLEDTSNSIGGLNYAGNLTIRTDTTAKYWERKLEDGTYETINLADYGITQTAGTLYYNKDTSLEEEDRPDYVVFKISKATQIRDEVVAKSILAGKTPLLEASETAMDYSFLNPYVKTYGEVAEIEGNTSIEFSTDNDYKYTMNANELIQFYAPQYEQFANYSNYIKFEYILKSDIVANSNRKLAAGEYIIFYYESESDSSGIYQYHAYGMGSVVNLTFTLKAGQTAQHITSILPEGSEIPTSLAVIPLGWRKSIVGGHVFFETYTTFNGTMDSTVSTEIEDITKSEQILVDEKTATINTISSIIINNSYYCYWILNSYDTSLSEDNVVNRNYILFDTTDTERILANGEYFVYTDTSLSQLYILGAGTKLTRSTNDLGTIVAVTADVDFQDLFDTGAIQTSGKFYRPDPYRDITCVKNDSIYLSNGCKIWLQPISSEDVPESVIIDKDGVSSYPIMENPLSKFTIRYSTADEVDYSQQLTVIDDTEYAWDAIAMLQIVLNASAGQILTDGQTITIYGDNWSTEEEGEIIGTDINGSDTKTHTELARDFYVTLPESTTAQEYITIGYNYTYYPVVVFANKQITISTAGKTEIAEYDTDGNISYTDISLGKYNYSTYPLAGTTTTDGNVVLSIAPPSINDTTSKITNSVIYPVQFIPGNYIAQLTSSSTELEKLRMHFMKLEELYRVSTGEATYTISSKPQSLVKIYNINNDVANMSTLLRYSTGTIFECKLNNERTIDPNLDFSTAFLKQNEYVIFYQKVGDQYQYIAYSEGNIANFSTAVYTDSTYTGAVLHNVADKIVDFNQNMGTIENPGDGWEVVAVGRHYYLTTSGLVPDDQTTLIDNLAKSPQYVLSEEGTLSYYCDLGFTTDATRTTIVPKSEATETQLLAEDYFEYNSTSGIITIGSGAIPETDTYLVIITSNLEYIDDSDITTMYGETNLVMCDKTPVKFKVADEFDPATYDLPIYITARITLGGGLTRLNSTELITITNPEKYIYNSNLPSAKIDKYEELVRRLDVNKVFNYSYEIKDEELIEDPLDPASFLNTNHPYNKCTICQYYGSATDLEVVEKE